MIFGTITYEYLNNDGVGIVTSNAYTVDTNMLTMVKDSTTYVPATGQTAQIITNYTITEDE